MTRKTWLILSVALNVVLLGVLGYVAFEHLDNRYGEIEHRWPFRAEARPGTRLPLEEARRIALSYVPGEIVTVELDRDDGIDVFEIGVLAQNGRVRELKLDAKDGRLLEIED
ncbi:MAG: PepSY domain-containing protein [Steroidobacteraceae bacterium]|nr:PepSY domain-containing protein [Steroidobacteraceae bacterium]